MFPAGGGAKRGGGGRTAHVVHHLECAGDLSPPLARGEEAVVGESVRRHLCLPHVPQHRLEGVRRGSEGDKEGVRWG
eukprot:1122842-Prorocentrum_minimum.AAC.2